MVEAMALEGGLLTAFVGKELAILGLLFRLDRSKKSTLLLVVSHPHQP